MSGGLAGRTIVIVGRGSDLDRQLAVRCAEAGAAIALGTVADTQEQEFGLNSIANEIWSIGQPNLVRQMYAWNPDAAADFAAECDGKLGPCDVLIVNSKAWSHAPFEALTEAEWEATMRANVAVPFFQAQAFARGMAKRGKGLVLVISPVPTGGDTAEVAAHGAIAAMIDHLARWGRSESVGFGVIDGTTDSPEQAVNHIFNLITERETGEARSGV